MSLRRMLPLLAVPVVLVVAGPALANVSQYYADGQLNIQGDDAHDLVSLACPSGLVVPAPSTGPAACNAVTGVFVDPGAGNDEVYLNLLTLADFPAITSISVRTDDGERDQVVGSPMRDEVVGDSSDEVHTLGGNDLIMDVGKLVDAGDGDDILVRVNASDGYTGGAGDDLFLNSLTAGGMDGGAGDDTWEVDFRPGGIDSLALALTPSALQIRFPTGSVSYPLTNMEHAAITLPGGTRQSLDAWAFPGDVTVLGWSANDTVRGSRKSDVLRTGHGNDTIDARDGVYDLVDCGPGTDTALVDAIDKVVGCEKITYAKPSTSAIRAAARVKRGSALTASFTSTVPGSVFGCKVDGGAWKTCKSPYKVATKSLAKGKHTLRVRAGYPRGNWDLTPSAKTFTVT